MQVRTLMQPTTEVVHLDNSLLDAAIRLRRLRLPALAVVDGDEIVGLLTAEAVQRKAASPDNDLAQTAVRDHMATEIAVCGPDESVETARGIMQQGGHSRLLVVDGRGRLCGLLAGEKLAAQGDKATPQSEHVVKTPGRALGDRPHQPGNYSVEPLVRK